jgi:hypothetical protein
MIKQIIYFGTDRILIKFTHKCGKRRKKFRVPTSNSSIISLVANQMGANLICPFYFAMTCIEEYLKMHISSTLHENYVGTNYKFLFLKWTNMLQHRTVTSLSTVFHFNNLKERGLYTPQLQSQSWLCLYYYICCFL